jgi:hypothetical protein
MKNLHWNRSAFLSIAHWRKNFNPTCDQLSSSIKKSRSTKNRRAAFLKRKGLFAFFVNCVFVAHFAIFAKLYFFCRRFFIFCCCVHVVARARDFAIACADEFDNFSHNKNSIKFELDFCCF